MQEIYNPLIEEIGRMFMNIQISSEILMDNLLTIQKCNSEIQSLLNQTENTIREKINQSKDLSSDKLLNLIVELSIIQENIAFVLFKFEYQVSDFLYDFIYDFDRIDDHSIKYIIKKYF